MDFSRWSRWTTIAAVLMPAVVSYSHMYELALRHGEPEWRSALFPLSVDGMIIGASMTLLSDSRHGRKGGLLPWALLIIGSGGVGRLTPARAGRTTTTPRATRTTTAHPRSRGEDPWPRT